MPRAQRARTNTTCPLCPKTLRAGEYFLIHFDSKLAGHKACVIGYGQQTYGDSKAGRTDGKRRG